MKRFVDVVSEWQGVDVVMTQFGCSKSERDLLQVEMCSEFGQPWMGLASHVVGPLDPKFGHNLLNWGCRPLCSESVGDALS